MTPKEKAKELLIKFLYYVESFSSEQQNENAKQCALISVDEILNSNPSYDDYGGNGWIIIDNSEYWEQVKVEINEL